MYFGYFEVVVLECFYGFVEGFVFGDVVYCYFKGMFSLIYKSCSSGKVFFSKIRYYVFEIFVRVV